MPYINIKTNVDVTDAQDVEIKSGLGRIVQLIPGKTELGMMACIEGGLKLYLGGDKSRKNAVVEFKIMGTADREVFVSLTKSLTELLNNVLGIESSRIFVLFMDEINTWGCSDYLY